jgi:2-polyprenyl-6-methoxyphenol hydroxylase-like FAD-dependent oxidoreductase
MATDTQVLVVGAGPVGLFMAAELNRHGVSCRIVDKNDGPTHASRAASIQARTLEIRIPLALRTNLYRWVTSAMPQPPILPTTNSSNT